MRQRALLVTACILLSPMALGEVNAPAPAAAAAPAPAPVIGVSDQPCRGVPTEQTAAHNATADPYQSWMHEWLSLDWGQLCRYQAENSHLPPASATRVVFMGDSITDGWKSLDPGLFGNDRLDRGISGQTTGQMLLRFRADVLDLHPAVVHILAGTNDIAGNTGFMSLGDIEANLQTMTELARVHKIRVVLSSVLPVNNYPERSKLFFPLRSPGQIGELNRWIKDYCGRNDCVYLDYFSAMTDNNGLLRIDLSADGLHPNEKGYSIMAPLARKAIDQALAAH